MLSFFSFYHQVYIGIHHIYWYFLSIWTQTYILSPLCDVLNQNYSSTILIDVELDPAFPLCPPIQFLPLNAFFFSVSFVPLPLPLSLLFLSSSR